MNLQAVWITGASKDARKTRANILSVLAAQTKLCILTEPGEGEAHTIYAVVFGVDRSDGEFGDRLATAYNLSCRWAKDEDLMAEIAALRAENEALKGSAATTEEEEERS